MNEERNRLDSLILQFFSDGSLPSFQMLFEKPDEIDSNPNSIIQYKMYLNRCKQIIKQSQEKIKLQMRQTQDTILMESQYLDLEIEKQNEMLHQLYKKKHEMKSKIRMMQQKKIKITNRLKIDNNNYIECNNSYSQMSKATSTLNENCKILEKTNSYLKKNNTQSPILQESVESLKLQILHSDRLLAAIQSQILLFNSLFQNKLKSLSKTKDEIEEFNQRSAQKREFMRNIIDNMKASLTLKKEKADLVKVLSEAKLQNLSEKEKIHKLNSTIRRIKRTKENLISQLQNVEDRIAQEVGEHIPKKKKTKNQERIVSSNDKIVFSHISNIPESKLNKLTKKVDDILAWNACARHRIKELEDKMVSNFEISLQNSKTYRESRIHKLQHEIQHDEEEINERKKKIEHILSLIESKKSTLADPPKQKEVIAKKVVNTEKYDDFMQMMKLERKRWNIKYEMHPSSVSLLLDSWSNYLNSFSDSKAK